MSSSFTGSFDQFGGDSPAAGSNHSFDDGYFESQVPESPSIYASGGTFPSDPVDFSPEIGSNGPILPPPEEMVHEEGYALREWRRQNAMRLEDKERREKELLNQIIVEADHYKAEFHQKLEINREANISTNREKEKIFVASQDKFHAEADKDYWKSIADLIPKEIPAIAKRKGKKEQENKPSIVVVQGPKSGKPTDLSRMRQLLLKLKHNTPPHLNPSPATAPDAKTDTSAAPITVSPEAVAAA